MRRKSDFTLVELLTVIAIISVLAGLSLPAISKIQAKARVTQAKSDIASIMTALKGVEGTYNKIVVASNGEYKFNGEKVDTEESGQQIRLGPAKSDAYDGFIVELSDPANSNLSSLNVNKRKIRFLDPKPKYDPTATIANNKKELWRDPWGNPYVILINVDYNDRISIGGRTLSGKVAVYSYGPNGVDNSGKNIAFDDSASREDDDVASWQ